MTPDEVQRIAAIRSPVLRNLQITYAYSLLAAEITARSGQGANWCTFATWASRQAGRTIRGEDAIGFLQDRLHADRELLHPLQSIGRWLLRRGLFDPTSRLGRIMGRLHTPFDAVEAASNAVARGNLKVFAEIGYEFARYLSGDEFAVEEPLLQVAFACYDEAFATDDPKRRAELMLRANLCIGLHEQTRLQPEIGEALDAPYVTAEELGRHAVRDEAAAPGPRGGRPRAARAGVHRPVLARDRSRTRSWSCPCRAGSSRWARTSRTRTRRRCTSSWTTSSSCW